MQMGLNEFSANEIVNDFDQSSLSKIFYSFGDEKKANNIARKIINFRKSKNIETQDLVKIIDSVYKKKFKKIHNSTKVFQAIRIFVNKEISELIESLIVVSNYFLKEELLLWYLFILLKIRLLNIFFIIIHKIKILQGIYLKKKEKNII